jgi:hypothetical protein
LSTPPPLTTIQFPQFLENVELAVSFKDISAHSKFLLGMALSQTPSRSRSARGGGKLGR